MEPDIGHRVGALLRALEEVILPAVDPQNKPALEQARQCITNLRVIAAQHDKAYHLALAELRLYAGLLERLDVAAGAVIEPALRAALQQAQASAWKEFRVPATTHLESITRGYRELAEAILAAPSVLADARVRQQVDGLIMSHSAEETAMQRAWMLLMGVEADPAALPSIDAIVAAVTSPEQARS